MTENSPTTEAIEQLQHTLLRIERLLAIGFAEPVGALRAGLDLGDPVSAAILRCCPAWTPAGRLKGEVAKASGGSGTTIKRRLAALQKAGALESRGKTASLEYRNTGLLG
jgi:hypothetical protein